MNNIRKEVITFLIIFTVQGVVFTTLIVTNGGPIDQNPLAALGFMFSPAFAALLTNFIYHKNLRGFGWKWGKTRYQIWAYVVPMIYALISYGLILLLGLGKLNTETASGLSVVDVLQSVTLGVVVNCVIVLGEEIGWRGFLLPKLTKIMSFTKASIIVGVVWILFHVPPILFVKDFYPYSTPVWYGLFCFSVAAMGVNFAINWLRLKSGSIWTAVIFHAVHNQIVLDLDSLVIDTGITQYFTLEYGMMLALAGAIVDTVLNVKRQN
ncbi:MAG: CPBP family intramembrane metalloprotease [Anaerolineaceae bacterium]|nr:CPBP family intramembrane metalloprotease [Anaerolineaceae bacterium]